MKMLWCWRCKAEMPMLDEEEFRRVSSLVGRLGKFLPEHKFGASIEEFERITGLPVAGDGTAIFHHRLSMYGPPCSKCGKPLRTPRAKLCGSCIAPVNSKA